LDWCAIDDIGDIYCWRNGKYFSSILSDSTDRLQEDTTFLLSHKGVTGKAWLEAAIRSKLRVWTFEIGKKRHLTSTGMPGIEGVRLIDINGDQRADWVYVYPDGHTKIFINQRGTKADGPGLRPSWVEAAVAHRGFPDEKSTHSTLRRFQGHC
jgi:hypothetical protein